MFCVSLVSIRVSLGIRNAGGKPVPMPLAITTNFCIKRYALPIARLAQSAERKALNLVVVGSSPTVGAVVQKHKNLMQNLPCLD